MGETSEDWETPLSQVAGGLTFRGSRGGGSNPVVPTGPGRHPLDGDAALGCFYQRNIPLWRFWPVLAVAARCHNSRSNSHDECDIECVSTSDVLTGASVSASCAQRVVRASASAAPSAAAITSTASRVTSAVMCE